MSASLELQGMALLSIPVPFKERWIRVTIPEEGWSTFLPGGSFSLAPFT